MPGELHQLENIEVESRTDAVPYPTPSQISLIIQIKHDDFRNSESW